jgi:hypothetical protein
MALIFGAAARRFAGGVGAAIAASASVGYLGFLVAADRGIFVWSHRVADGTRAGGRGWSGYLLCSAQRDGGACVAGKQQLLSLSALSPEVTAEFSSGVDLPTTVFGSGRVLHVRLSVHGRKMDFF